MTRPAAPQDVEVECGNPHLFWSAGEDGYLCQYDVRLRTSSGGQAGALNSHALVNLRREPGTSRMAEFKAVSICPHRPHLIATACGDSVARVYDRLEAPSQPSPHVRGPQADVIVLRRMLAVGSETYTPPVHRFSPRKPQRSVSAGSAPPRNPLPLSSLISLHDLTLRGHN